LASSLPIVRQVAWLSLVPQLVVMAAMVALAAVLGFDNPFLAAALPYLFLVLVLRRAIPKNHRAGMKFFKQERFAEAVPEFQKSYDFFLEHRWLDNWRAVTILSGSRISYREMALLNLAFCLGQIGQRAQALTAYKQALAEFPESKIAKAAIKMMDDSSLPEQVH